MAVTGLVLRVALACVFAVSGGMKIFSTGKTAVAVRDFGMPRRVAVPIAVALPLVELLTAALLLGSGTAAAGLLVAVGLLGAFVAVTAVVVVRHRAVSCNCFGNLTAKAVTIRTVLRNIGLLVAAMVTAGLTVASLPVPGIAYGQLDGTQWAVIALAVALAVVCGAFWRAVSALLAQHGRLLLRLDALEGRAPTQAATAPVSSGGLQRGEAPPEFDLESITGNRVSLRSALGAGRPLLVVFSDPQCSPCAEVMPTVAHWQREHAAELRTVVIASGSAQDNAAKAVEHHLTEVLLDPDRTVAAAYRSPGTPSAVLVGQDGVVLDSAVGRDGIGALAGTVISGHDSGSSAPEAVSGRSAPSFSLPDLNEQLVSESNFGKREFTVVLFWNPSCGFCQRMEPRLHHWRIQHAESDTPLLIISTGQKQALSSLESLGCPVLSDDGSVSPQFGATGTPMGLLVDRAGIIRSELAAGEQAVFELLEPLTTHKPQLPIIEGAHR